MSTATIFNYCERGRDASFWAEPLNALSNAAFVIAGLAALLLIASRSKAANGLSNSAGGVSVAARGWLEVGLALLLIVIGIGSFLFHTYATPWSARADAAPIGVFMLAYFSYALRRFMGWHPLLIVAALTAFASAMKYAGDLTCAASLMPITAAAGRPCLNGSPGYVPALMAMLLIGGALTALRHPAGRRVLAAGLIFAVSLTARTLDFEFCAATNILGAVRGTHMVWHVMNAVTLYLLTSAAILYGVTNKRDVR